MNRVQGFQEIKSRQAKHRGMIHKVIFVIFVVLAIGIGLYTSPKVTGLILFIIAMAFLVERYGSQSLPDEKTRREAGLKLGD